MRPNDMPSIEVFKAHFNYDPITGIFTHKYSRKGCSKGSSAGSPSKDGRIRLIVNYRRYLASRVAYFWIHDWCPDIVDHEDRNPINDAIINLRAATVTQNVWNSSPHSNKKSGLPKGIRLSRNGKKYRVTIQINKYRFSVGTFNSLQEAVLARNMVAQKHHGEFFVLEELK